MTGRGRVAPPGGLRVCNFGGAGPVGRPPRDPSPLGDLMLKHASAHPLVTGLLGSALALSGLVGGASPASAVPAPRVTDPRPAAQLVKSDVRIAAKVRPTRVYARRTVSRLKVRVFAPGRNASGARRDRLPGVPGDDSAAQRQADLPPPGAMALGRTEESAGSTTWGTSVSTRRPRWSSSRSDEGSADDVHLREGPRPAEGARRDRGDGRVADRRPAGGAAHRGAGRVRDVPGRRGRATPPR